MSAMHFGPRRLLLAACALVVLAPSLARAQDEGVAIDHKSVGCVVAERFVELHASLVPVDRVARARVLFRGDARGPWYFVDMRPVKGVHTGYLPRPLKTAKTISYYVEVLDRGFGEHRTPEYTPQVVGAAGACDKRLLLGLVGRVASVAVGGPAGAAVPLGFSPFGVTTVAATTSASATAGAAAAAGGGGIGTAAIAVGAGVAAAGVAVAKVAGGGGDSSRDHEGEIGKSVIYQLDFLPLPQGMDVSACAGRHLTWNGQVVSAPNGTFDVTWAPNEPNVMRVAGTLNDTSFSATLSCVSGPGSGSIQASGSGGRYQGSWSFAGQNGTVSIARN
jgi:hypothetical protein